MIFSKIIGVGSYLPKKVLSNKNYRPFFVYENNNLIIDNSFRQSSSYLLLKSNIVQKVIKLSDYSRIVQLSKEIYLNKRFKRKKYDKKLHDNKKSYIPLEELKTGFYLLQVQQYHYLILMIMVSKRWPLICVASTEMPEMGVLSLLLI